MNGYEKPPKVEWSEASSLEQWVHRMLEAGKDREVIQLIKLLPEGKREKYRAICRGVRGGGSYDRL